MELDEPVPADDPAPVEPTPVEPPVDIAPVSTPAPPVAEETASTGNGHPREEEVVQEARPSKRARREEETVAEVAAVEEPVEEAVVEESVPIEEKQVVEEVAKVEEAVAAVVEKEEEPPVYNFEPEVVDLSTSDMYLDTVNLTFTNLASKLMKRCQINRSALDFDFERLCSVTLSQNNIYACLVDGKYFQGRGKNSPAYAHSIAEDKHVYINMTTHKVSSFVVVI